MQYYHDTGKMFRCFCNFLLTSEMTVHYKTKIAKMTRNVLRQQESFNEVELFFFRVICPP